MNKWGYIKKIQQLTEAEKGYIAATIDCEGCLRAEELNPDSYVTVGGGLVVVNTNKVLLDRLYSLTGAGSINNHTKRKNRNHKPTFCWAVRGGKQLTLLLQTVYPYIVIKREQAELLMELCDLKAKSTSRRKFYVERQYEILDRLHELNRRGVNYANEELNEQVAPQVPDNF